MKKLFCVELSYENVVLANTENQAISIALEVISNDDPDSNCTQILNRKDIPNDWLDGCPYGEPDREEMDGTCRDIFERMEAKEAEKKKQEAIDKERERRQLKFDFMGDEKDGK
jgi:hypothetical protein